MLLLISSNNLQYLYYHSTSQEPPNLQEVLKPIQNINSPAVAVKDEDDEEGEGEEGDVEKTEINVNPERLKAFNVSMT